MQIFDFKAWSVSVDALLDDNQTLTITASITQTTTDKDGNRDSTTENAPPLTRVISVRKLAFQFIFPASGQNVGIDEDQTAWAERTHGAWFPTPFCFKLSDPQIVGKVIWLLDGATGEAHRDSSGDPTLWYFDKLIPANPLGALTLTVQAGGLQDSAAFKTVDFRPPTFGIAFPPMKGHQQPSGQPLTFSGWAKDFQSGVAKLEWSHNGGAFREIGHQGDWNSWSFTLPVAELSTGRHQLAVRLTDNVGNTTGDAAAIVDFEVAGVYRPQVANDLVSLRAYLEDLLEFSNNHLAVGPTESNTQVDTVRLAQIFYQPFQLLADARVPLGQQPVNQLRAAIEILRRYNADLRSGVSTPTALVAYWPFDKGGGTEALDASGHHYDAVLSDDHMWAAGRAGFTLEFKFNEVTHSSVKVPIKPELDALTNDFTIAFWAKPTPDVTIEIQTEGTSGSDGIQGQHYVWGPKQGMIRRGQPSTAGVGISLGANGIAVYEYSVDFTGGIGSSAPVVLPPLLVYTPPSSQFSTWMHVALVYRQGQPSLYLDGKLVKTGLKSLRALSTPHPRQSGATSGGYYVGLARRSAHFRRRSVGCGGGHARVRAGAGRSATWLKSDGERLLPEGVRSDPQPDRHIL